MFIKKHGLGSKEFALECLEAMAKSEWDYFPSAIELEEMWLSDLSFILFVRNQFEENELISIHHEYYSVYSKKEFDSLVEFSKYFHTFVKESNLNPAIEDNENKEKLEALSNEAKKVLLNFK